MRNGNPLHTPALALDAALVSDLDAAGVPEGDRAGLHVAEPTHVILAISDGTGLPEGVELGSRRALSALLATYRELPTGTTLTQRMMRAARNASFATYELAIVLPQLHDVSTTLTAIAVAGGQMTAAHVGNGRVYLRRDGTLTQLSKDHTVAAEAEAQGGSHFGPDGDRLTRALARELLVAIDIFEIELRPGDAVVICTHAIHHVLPDDVIDAELARDSAAEACHGLVERARRSGAPGGLSVGVVRLVETPAVMPGPRG